jgi:hypothetical protein
MAILTKGQTFSSTDDVTSTKLHNLVDSATFVSGSSGATDDSTLEVSGGGQLRIKDLGVTSSKLAASAVTTSKLANSTSASDGVTYAKIQQVANMRVIGNTSGSLAAPSEVSILDEDNMATDSSTALATQQSIKAYVNSGQGVKSTSLDGGQTGTAPIFGVRAWVVFDATRNSSGGSDTLNTARFLINSGNVTSVTRTAQGAFTVAFTTALPNANYAYFGSSVEQASDEITIYRPIAGTKTTSSFQVETIRRDGTNRDPQEACLSFIG